MTVMTIQPGTPLNVKAVIGVVYPRTVLVTGISNGAGVRLSDSLAGLNSNFKILTADEPIISPAEDAELWIMSATVTGVNVEAV